MVHPDKVMDDEELARMPAVEPVYGLTEGLYPRTVQKAAQAALGEAAGAAGMARRGALRGFDDLSFAAALKRAARARGARATSSRRARRADAARL